MIELLKNLVNNLGYIIVIAFIVTNVRSFKKILQKDAFNKVDLVILSIIFGGFGILGTYVGTEINGAIANTRIIGVMTGGIMCGPIVGIAAGLIAAIHRVVIYPIGITSVPCSIATVLSGALSGYIYIKNKKRQKNWYYGFFGVIVMESIEMILILSMSKPFKMAFYIVKNIYIPMTFANGIGIALVILLIQKIHNEKEEIGASEAKLALEIANKTLPYFRYNSDNAYDKICDIIKKSTKADAVAITDRERILAHVGLGHDHHVKGEHFLTEGTKKVVNKGEIMVLKGEDEINCKVKNCPLKSAIIVPLKEGTKTIGTLKIYYAFEEGVSYKNIKLAEGLSQIISTQIEISKVEKLKEMANKAEIKALQAQINPHFLFNALNTISSFVRINPDKARELIINLSTYLRYNIDVVDEMVDIYDEIKQIKAYIDIEKARFGDKLSIIYEIDENLNLRIPNLIIEPIVENSVKHGIIPTGEKGIVKISINKTEDESVKVCIEDNGIGISQNIINKVYSGEMDCNKIGISNVNTRLKIFYGKGLNIEKLKKGTRTTFILNERMRKDELHNSRR
ncbi:LytS/YhcK type 5TM receptor domain-containing protein [Haloimpatiens sp. FM7315]|uniref:LytS/YhcK type 5TM receptor domain-containing protein n=1 Tax=Haloimpatiens sp. FM7315 TaxID=3298609 RepID=UPI00370B86CB